MEVVKSEAAFQENNKIGSGLFGRLLNAESYQRASEDNVRPNVEVEQEVEPFNSPVLRFRIYFTQILSVFFWHVVHMSPVYMLNTDSDTFLVLFKLHWGGGDGYFSFLFFSFSKCAHT